MIRKTHGHFRDFIAKLNKIIADYWTGIALINREFDDVTKNKAPEAEHKQETRKKNLLITVTQAWEKTAREIKESLAIIRRQQPAFENLDEANPGNIKEIPDALFFGSQQVSFNELHCRIPFAVRFPFEHAFILPEDNLKQRRMAHHFLLRLLSSIPPGQLELSLVDPMKLGQSVAPFLPLLRVEQLVPQQRVLTRADEIEDTLCKLTDEVEDLIQHRFKGRISNWSEFNATNSDNQLQYKVVLLFDIPEQLSDKSQWYLKRLIEHGPRCGILPVIAANNKLIEEKKFEEFRVILKNNARQFEELFNVTFKLSDGMVCTYQAEKWPQQEVLDKFMATLSVYYAENARFNKALPELWTGFVKDSMTTDGFDIPIGWTDSGDIVPLRLGATNSEHHALLAGKTGAGKSNLLHVIIHTLCEKYASHEVDLYLLDLKESVEFNVYASPPLPHARLVATESDPEYGVTVLQHLADELEERARIFKSEDVQNFAEYRRLPCAKLPRILLIIDEFQVLFTETRQVAENAERLLLLLFKQGRAFGIHILLATQTLKGINALSMGALISQMGCRIALTCGQEESAMILSGNNWAAADLKGPPDGIINNNNGAKSGNIKFLIPLAEKTFCRSHLAEMSDHAGKSGMKCKTQIFNGANLPGRPEFNKFKSICGKSDVILMGKMMTFTAEELTIPLTRRATFNLLFCGYDDPIHDGLLCSTIASLSCINVIDEVVYFNGRGIEPDGDFNDVIKVMGIGFKMFSSIETLPLQEISDSIGKRHIVLIIDGLDSEKTLYPVQTFKAPKQGEPPAPADLLKRIADEGPRTGIFVFAFIDNWHRCAVQCKDLFNFFELRVAFCMNEDDAGSLVNGSIGKFRGIEKPNRAVFVNRMKHEIHWFRPYIAGADI